MKQIFFALLLLPQLLHPAPNCSQLTSDINDLQKKQNEMALEEETLGQLQQNYDQKYARLLLLNEIKKLKDNYYQNLNEFFKDKLHQLQELRDIVQDKLNLTTNLIVMENLIDQVMQSSYINRETPDTWTLNNIVGEEGVDPSDRPEQAAGFYQKLQDICQDHADDQTLILCRDLSSHQDQIKLFFNAYAANSTPEDLQTYKDALKDGMPALQDLLKERELADQMLSTFDALPDQTSQEATALKTKADALNSMVGSFEGLSAAKRTNNRSLESDYYSKLSDCFTPASIAACKESGEFSNVADELGQKLIDNYSSLIDQTKGVKQGVLTKDFYQSIAQELKEEAGEKIQAILESQDEQGLLPNRDKKTLEQKLLQSYKIMTNRMLTQGVTPSDAMINEMQALDPENGRYNPDKVFEMMHAQMLENNICAGETLLTCLESFNVDRFDTVMGETKDQLKEMKEKIDQIQAKGEYSDMDKLKNTLVALAKKACGKEEYASERINLSVCTEGWLSGCFGNSLDSIELLDNTFVAIDHNIANNIFIDHQQRLDNYCSQAKFAEMASASCEESKLRNRIALRERTYINADYEMGKRATFGEILGQGFAKALPSSASGLVGAYFNNSFYYTKNVLYPQAMYTKIYNYNLEKWYEDNEDLYWSLYSGNYSESYYYYPNLTSSSLSTYNSSFLQ